MRAEGDTVRQCSRAGGASRPEQWAGLVAIALLAGVSVVGAFLAPGRMRAALNSPQGAVLVFLLAGLLVARLLRFKTVVRSPWLLPVYLGPLLILLGAMYGSEVGHEVARRFLRGSKVSRGYMFIPEGSESSDILDTDLSRRIGKLPFNLRLHDSRIDYYQPRDSRWDLVVLAPSAGDDPQTITIRREQIEWALGEEASVPSIGAAVRVLSYLEGARPVFAEGAEPLLEVIGADGQVARIRAEAGRQVSVKEPEATVRVMEVIEALQQAAWLPSWVDTALKVEVERADGAAVIVYVVPSPGTQSKGPDGLKLRYILPKPIGAEADPDAGVPAMEILVTYGGRQIHEWLIARKDRGYVELSLEGPRRERGDDEGTYADVPPSLVLVEPTAQVRDYKSDIEVVERGEAVARKVIGVNRPLHYGGYHLYEHSFDHPPGQFAVLLVTSDSGLWLVYAGFGLLCLGVFWWCWAKPAYAYLTRRGGRDGG